MSIQNLMLIGFHFLLTTIASLFLQAIMEQEGQVTVAVFSPRHCGKCVTAPIFISH